MLASSVGWSGARSSARWDHQHACLHQRRPHTLLCGSRWLWPRSAGRTCTSPFSLNPLHANLDMAHPQTLPLFSLHNLSFLCVWLLTAWGFCGLICMCQCEKETHRHTSTCLGERVFLQWLQYDACHSRKSGEIQGLFRCFYSVCTFAFGNRFDRKERVCTYLKIILLRIHNMLFLYIFLFGSHSNLVRQGLVLILQKN